jgi:hypothetical protein
MSDLISAAGILVGVVGVLYGVWYPEIAKALSIDTTRLIVRDAKSERRTIESALWKRAVPLAVGATLISLVLLPNSFSIVSTSIGTVAHQGINSIWLYDAVSACFLLVEIFAIWLAYSTSRTVCRLRRALRALKASAK